MVPGMHVLETRRNLTGNHLTILSYHQITTRQTLEHGAQFFLGESPEFKHFDLCYSFKTLVHVEYGSLRRLHEAAWNYRNNRAKVFGTSDDTRMSYEKALSSCLGTTSMDSRAMGPGKVTGPSWLWNASL